MDTVFTPVLIVGAGPSGLLLALSLAQNGVIPRIIDKVPIPRLGQRGVGITPRTLEVYNILDVLPDIQKRAIMPMPLRSYELPEGTKPLRTWSMYPEEDVNSSIPFPSTLWLGQDKAEEILRSHLEKYSIHVEFGTELVSFIQDDEGVVAEILKTKDGHETRETTKVNWLVGADGAKGVVRKQLGLNFIGETRDDQHLILGDIHLEGLDRDHWHMWGNSSDKSVSIRTSEDKNGDVYSIYVNATGVDHAKLAGSREELIKFIVDVTGRSDFKFGETIWVSDWRPNVRMVSKFSEGRVFVVGDAAHVHSPAGGQGMNSSMQDSFNLGWKLAWVEKGLSPTSFLSTYNEERAPVIAELLKQSKTIFNHTFFGNVRNEEAWFRGTELYQLGVNYRWSSIVVDKNIDHEGKANMDAYGLNGDGHVRAGDRAPDAPGLLNLQDTHETSFFRIFSYSHHTVLVFTGNAQKSASILDALTHYPSGTVLSAVVLSSRTTPSDLGITRADIVLRDKDGHAYKNYQMDPEGCTVVVVRPDGVVGAVVDDIECIRTYFKGVYGA